jgi:hypothetical protein
LPDNFRAVPNKKAVDVDGVCGYPETAVVAGLIAKGWDARWRKNFGGVGWWVEIGVDKPLPRAAQGAVNSISNHAAELAPQRDIVFRGAGIWDVIAWQDRKFVFVEVKGSEPLNANQLLWLEAALDLEVPLGSFAMLRYSVEVRGSGCGRVLERPAR